MYGGAELKHPYAVESQAQYAEPDLTGDSMLNSSTGGGHLTTDVDAALGQ